MPAPTFDIIIIGSGSAGVSAAEAAHEAGAKAIGIIESAPRLGGECPNRGCVPTKALLRSAEVLTLARRAKEFGLKIPKAGFDFGAVMRRKQKIIDMLTGGGRIERLFGRLGMTLIRGEARFVGKDAVAVSGKRYSAKRFVIATGSEPSIPPIEGLSEAGYLTSDDLVALKKAPKSMVIIGGGPIGVESAQIFVPFGTKVAVVEFASQLLPREDADVAAVVAESFKRQRIAVFAAHKTTAVKRAGKARTVIIVSASGGKEKRITAEAVLVAAGKRPAVGKLDLAKAGIELDKRGAPALNGYLQTTNPLVYFAGDAAGQMLFTPVAHEQGAIAAGNAMRGNARRSDLSVIPRGTFCTPEVGSVGLTEREAREKGYDVGVGKVPYAYFGKALVTGEMEGVIKIVVDKKTGLVLGGHVAGQAAAELVHEMALAMYAKIPFLKIAEMVHAYPTFAEGIGAAASSVV